jgi:hypothetical protein
LEQAEVVWLGYRRVEGEWVNASRRFSDRLTHAAGSFRHMIELPGGLDGQGPRTLGLALVGA